MSDNTDRTKNREWLIGRIRAEVVLNPVGPSEVDPNPKHQWSLVVTLKCGNQEQQLMVRKQSGRTLRSSAMERYSVSFADHSCFSRCRERFRFN